MADNITHDHRSDLQCWFGLSYALFLTLPRVLMEAMPEEWQAKMAAPLWEYQDTFPNQPDVGTRVQITQNGKLMRTREWLINYRHPDYSAIIKLRIRGKPCAMGALPCAMEAFLHLLALHELEPGIKERVSRCF